MKYSKPQIELVENACEVIQSGSKGSLMTADSVFPHTTVSAYEADE